MRAMRLRKTCAEPLNIYVAGPFSADTEALEIVNIERAGAIGHALASIGHRVHVPHLATCEWHKTSLGYEYFMDLDFSLIRKWADALFYIAPSPGTDRELALANELGLQVFKELEDVPVIVYTGKANPQAKPRREVLGSCLICRKPVNKDSTHLDSSAGV